MPEVGVVEPGIKEGIVEEVKPIDLAKTASILFDGKSDEGKTVDAVKIAADRAAADAKIVADAKAVEDAKAAEKVKADEAAKVEAVKDDKTKTDDKPVEYQDFKLPEGFVAEPEALKGFKDLAKDAKLTQEQAQKFIDMQTTLAAKQTQIAQEQWNATVKEWRETSTNDKEFGGKDFKANIGVAQKALEQFGTKEFKDMLENTKMGNHPEVIRFLVKVGKGMVEDKILQGGRTTAGPRDIAKTLFPNQN